MTAPHPPLIQPALGWLGGLLAAGMILTVFGLLGPALRQEQAPHPPAVPPACAPARGESPIG
jgi:hypothetical protein